MSRQPGQTTNKILIQHWRWLEDQGPSYKQQAASCKRQATRLLKRLTSSKLDDSIQENKGER